MNLSDKNLYRLIWEDGEDYYTHEELIKTGHIELIRDFAPSYGRNIRTGLILGRTIVTYSNRYLAQMPSVAETFAELQNEQITNPLQFFSPSGHSALRFLNDNTSKVCLMVASNRSGKTATMLIKCLLPLVKCDKTWPIFTEHGVDWQEPSVDSYAIASYKWEHISDVVMPELLRWMPIWEAEELIPVWRGGQGKRRSWQDQPTLNFQAGGRLRAHAYNQDQTTYESSYFRRWYWEEQPPEERWIGANERMRTTRLGQHNHSFTPHRVEGMEDATGGTTFLQALYDGEDLKGFSDHQVKRYRIELMSPKFDVKTYKEAQANLDALRAGEIYIGGDVPDWIYPISNRIDAYDQHIVEPLKSGSTVKHGAGRSRVFGAFESYECLMVPQYDRKVHAIEPFPIPYANVTLYRYIDHGRVRPQACLWGMVPRPGWTMTWKGWSVTFPEEPIIIFFREYYVAGEEMITNAHGIIKASGNEVVPDGHASVKGHTYRRFKEKFIKEKYFACKGDMGSINKPVDDGGMTLEQLYRIYGLNMQPTTRKLLKNRGDGAIDIMREWFRVDRSKPHLFYPDQMGFSRVYFFSNLINFHRELVTVVDPDTRRTREQDDHLLSTCMYILVDNPRYVEGSSYVRDEDDDFELDKMRKSAPILCDKFTGYPC